MRGHSFRAGLDNVEPAVFAVLGPFDIHRGRVPGEPGIMVLDADRVVRQFEYFLVGQAKALACGLGRRHVPGTGTASPARIDEPHLLAAERAAQDRAVTLAEGRLMDVELVRIHLALHDVFAKAPSAGNENHVAEPGFGVERKDDAARGEIRADHLHDADRQRDLEMVEAVVDAIDDGPVGEDRGKAPPACLDHLGLAAHVQETFVLPGEARSRQIFGGRRAAHRDCDPGAAFGLERAIGRRDLAAQIRIAGGFVDQLSGSRSALGEQRHIVVIEIGEKPAQLCRPPRQLRAPRGRHGR